ncbi:MAG: HPr family phosphocarrier protein [Phycisphaerae bacterium]|nr:HPr family phosphocarrier protein [Phycisphaerae bacterium]
MSGSNHEASREVTVDLQEGVHARPVMRFVDLASTFKSAVRVRNVTRRGEEVDGKSAMHMMLLEATRGCVLRISAEGEDAEQAVGALAELVQRGFDQETS